MTTTPTLPVPSTPVLDRMRAAVLHSDCPLLARKVRRATYFSHELRPVAEAAFGLGLPSKTAEVDIPLSSIEAISRENDFWYPGDCWRDLVTKRLDASDWPMGCIDYFENPIADNTFPPLTARGILELSCLGGITYCDNGNHRLAAAYCWLAATQGAHAKLQRVRTSMTLLDRRKIQAVLALDEKDAPEIAVFIPNEVQAMKYGSNTFVRITSKERCAYYRLGDQPELLHRHLGSAGASALQGLRSFLSEEYRDRIKGYQYMQWTVIPRAIMETWARCDWLEQTFSEAIPVRLAA